MAVTTKTLLQSTNGLDLAQQAEFRSAIDAANSVLRDIRRRKMLWLGDSITNGAGASNFIYSFTAMANKIVGSAKLPTTGNSAVINGGVPGNSAGQALARLPALIAQNPGYCHVMLGTNPSTNIATYVSDMTGILESLRKAQIETYVSLAPPVGSGVAAGFADRVNQYNTWLRLYCSRHGILCIDTFEALANRTTGYIAAANDSGDGIHPSDVGHAALSQLVAAAIGPRIPAIITPVGTNATGLLPNSIFVDALGWADGGGTAGTSTWGTAARVDGDIIPVGTAWGKLTVDNSAGGSNVYKLRHATCAITPAEGDKLLVCVAIKSDGNAIAGEGIKVVVRNGFTPFATVMEKPPTNAPGYCASVVTVPAAPTNIRLAIQASASAGEIASTYVGSAQVFNLTALGLDAEG